MYDPPDNFLPAEVFTTFLFQHSSGNQWNPEASSNFRHCNKGKLMHYTNSAVDTFHARATLASPVVLIVIWRGGQRRIYYLHRHCVHIFSTLHAGRVWWTSGQHVFFCFFCFVLFFFFGSYVLLCMSVNERIHQVVWRHIGFLVTASFAQGDAWWEIPDLKLWMSLFPADPIDWQMQIFSVWKLSFPCNVNGEHEETCSPHCKFPVIGDVTKCQGLAAPNWQNPL